MITPTRHPPSRPLLAVALVFPYRGAEEAVDRYQKQNFWKAMHEGFARLRADPAAWSEYQDEAALWDALIGDGLENEEPYFSVAEAKDEVAATTPRPRPSASWRR